MIVSVYFRRRGSRNVRQEEAGPDENEITNHGVPTEESGIGEERGVSRRGGSSK